MKFTFTFLLLGLLSFQINGQTFIEPCKYGQSLVSAVKQSYTPNQTLGYNPARDILYSTIDNVGNDLFGIYSNFKVTLDPTKDPSVSAFQNGVGINAEHVYPQSKGAGNEPMKSDMHNIYPCKVSVNSARGSCRFDDINDTDTDKWFFESTTTGSIPSSNIDAYSEKDDGACEFEPREAKKGDIARAVFYFYAIYQSQANSADPNFFNLQKDKLLEWHYSDLPDSIEIARNQAIASHQGNLNPFAVDTSLARRAFFMADASYPVGNVGCMDVAVSIDDIKKADWVKLRSNFVQNQLVLETNEQSINYQIININGQVAQSATLNNNQFIDVSQLTTGLYFIRMTNKVEMVTFKFFVGQ